MRPAHDGGEATVLAQLTVILRHSTSPCKPVYWLMTHALKAHLVNPATDKDLEERATPAALCSGEEEHPMATDPRKRQKQLARKAAKRKAAVASRKRSEGLPGAVSETRHMTIAAQAPLHECLMGREMFETGMGTVIVSRAMPNGYIGAAFFLLDVFCLGVKNAYFIAESREEYQWRLEHVAYNERLIPIAPAYACKLVKDAEAYARDLGFAPHADYQLAQHIFADIDATACSTRFTFGKDGKPFYIVGPHDSPQRMREILETLTRHCGPAGFHYLILTGDAPEFEVEENDAIIEAEYKQLQ